MSLFDDVKNNLVEWYSVTSEKTSEVARVTSRRYDKFGISRDIERQFSELGSLVYNGLAAGREDLLADEGVQILVGRISELETELRTKNAEIERIKREYAGRKAEAAAAGGASATVITDPVLPEGNEDSAILVEPVEVHGADLELANNTSEGPVDPELGTAGDTEQIDPKKEG